MIPTGILRYQRSAPQSLLSQKTDTLEVELYRLRPDAIKLYPSSRPRDLFVQFVIPFILGMNPDELRRTDLLVRDDLQLLDSGSAVTGMRRNRQSGLARS